MRVWFLLYTIIYRKGKGDKIMIYGYCRISTEHQSIERQIRNIKTVYPQAQIITEVFTGTKVDRPQFTRLLEIVKADDILIFDSVSRMSRNAKEGYEIYEKLFKDNVNLIFLKEPHINTETYKKALSNQLTMTDTPVDYILEGINRYLLELAKEQIRIAFEQAEKEVSDLRQRTREGIQTAKFAGKEVGRKKATKVTVKKEKPIKDIILAKSKSFNGKNTDAEVMSIINGTAYFENIHGLEVKKTYSISPNTYYKYKRELKNSLY